MILDYEDFFRAIESRESCLLLTAEKVYREYRPKFKDAEPDYWRIGGSVHEVRNYDDFRKILEHLSNYGV